MANRLENEDRMALLRIRENLMSDHDRLLDGSTAPATAMVKQSDVAAAFSRAIKSIEEVLTTAGGVEFTKR